MRLTAVLTFAAAIALLAGCERNHDAHDHADHDHAGHVHGATGEPASKPAGDPSAASSPSTGNHEHSHLPPHGGTLIPLGDHAAHVELLIDGEEGQVVLYVLDKEVQNSLRIANPELILEVYELDGAAVGAAIELRLAPFESTLTGEHAGSSSQFNGAHPRLTGLRSAAGRLRSIDVLGATYRDVEWRFPAGE